MTTRDEIDAAIDQLIGAARTVGLTSDWDRLQDDPKAWAACDAAKSRLLALLSPARPDGDVTPQMVEAAAKAWWTESTRQPMGPYRHVPWEAQPCDVRNKLCRKARLALTAALAAAHDRPEDGQR